MSQLLSNRISNIEDKIETMLVSHKNTLLKLDESNKYLEENRLLLTQIINENIMLKQNKSKVLNLLKNIKKTGSEDNNFECVKDNIEECIDKLISCENETNRIYITGVNSM